MARNPIDHDRALLLAARMRKLSDSLTAGVEEVYREAGVALSSRCLQFLLLLRDGRRLGISELALQLGLTHPAVSRMSSKLLRAKVVREWPDPRNDRRRLLSLSRRGAALMRRLAPVFRAIAAAVHALEADAPISRALTRIDQALAARSFARRIRAGLRGRDAAAVEIIPFAPKYARAFKRLNLEWLRKYFRVEPIDEVVLSRPTAILRRGGAILLARRRGEIIGTCALLQADEGRFELSKMAVTEHYQGLGVGRRLLLAAIRTFAAMRARELFLETNSVLAPAIKLYESVGFVHAARPAIPSHYERSDVYMVYRKPARRSVRASPR